MQTSSDSNWISVSVKQTHEFLTAMETNTQVSVFWILYEKESQCQSFGESCIAINLTFQYLFIIAIF